MSKLSAKLKDEIKALIPPAVFFFVALNIIALVRVLALGGAGITFDSLVPTTVGATIAAKAVLMADRLPFINLYPHKPLIYNVAWKTAIYVLVAVFIRYLGRLVDYWRETGGLAAGNEKLLSEIVWPHLWAIQIVLAVLILVYCVLRELIRVIGSTKVRQKFFGPLQRAAIA